MSVGEVLYKLSGPLGEVLIDCYKNTNDNNDKIPIQSAFFKRYEPDSSLFFRAASIVAAPVLFTGVSAFVAVCAGIEFCKAIIHLITDRQQAKQDIKSAGDLLLVAFISLLGGVISPIVGVVDLVGGGINSLLPDDDTNEQAMNQF